MAVDKKVLDGKLRLILLKGPLGNCEFTGDFDRSVLESTLEEGKAPHGQGCSLPQAVRSKLMVVLFCLNWSPRARPARLVSSFAEHEGEPGPLGSKQLSSLL
eukprot:scaffold324161_cov32-Prasinocladus_malaysianus.AAC.1